MKTLKQLLEDIGPLGQTEENTVELSKQNLVVSFFEKERKLHFSPLDATKPSPQARTFINDLKEKFKITNVMQQSGNIFVVTLDPREDFNLVLDYIKNASQI